MFVLQGTGKLLLQEFSPRMGETSLQTRYNLYSRGITEQYVSAWNINVSVEIDFRTLILLVTTKNHQKPPATIYIHLKPSRYRRN